MWFVIVDDKIRVRRNRKKWVVVGNLGAQKAKRNDTPISAKKDDERNRIIACYSR